MSNPGVTNSDLEHDIRQLMVQMAKIDAKLDHFILNSNELKTALSTMTSRVTELETRLNRYAGGLAVLVLILSLFGNKLIAIF